MFQITSGCFTFLSAVLSYVQLNNAIGSEDASLIIRVPYPEEWMMKRALDAAGGAHGIITPMCHMVPTPDLTMTITLKMVSRYAFKLSQNPWLRTLRKSPQCLALTSSSLDHLITLNRWVSSEGARHTKLQSNVFWLLHMPVERRLSSFVSSLATFVLRHC